MSIGALQNIFLGTTVDDDTGDEACIGGAKINSNFSYLSSLTGATVLALSALSGMIQALTLTSGGTGYASGGTHTYTNVPLFYKNAPANVPGAAATANIVVSSGVVTMIVINYFGTQYQAGDVLTTPNSYLGGSGSNFSCTVASVLSIDPTGVADSHAAVQLAINYCASTGARINWDCPIYCAIGTTGTATSTPYANTIFTPMNSTTYIEFTSNGLLIVDNVATPAFCICHSNIVLRNPIVSYVESSSGSAGSILATYNAGQILTFTITAAGSGYTPSSGSQTYMNVPVHLGSGNNAFANVTVTAGAVTNIAVATGGAGNSYVVSDSITVQNAYIGGTGSGFTASVATINSTTGTGFNAINNFANYTFRNFLTSGYVSGVTGNSLASGVNPVFNGLPPGSALFYVAGASTFTVYGSFTVSVPSGVPGDQYLPCVVSATPMWNPGTAITSSTPQNNATCSQPTIYVENPDFDGYVFGFNGVPKLITIKGGDFWRYCDLQNSAANDPYALQPGGNGTVFAPPHAIYCVSQCSSFPISAITTSGSSTVIALASSVTTPAYPTNPMYVGMRVGLTGIAGMTQLNEQFATVTAISGAAGSYQFTVSLNSSNYSAYTSGGSVVAGYFVESHVSNVVDHGQYGGYVTRRSTSSGVMIAFKAELANNNAWENIKSYRPDGGVQFVSYGMGQGKFENFLCVLDTTSAYAQNAGSTPGSSLGVLFGGSNPVVNGHATGFRIIDTAPIPAGYPIQSDSTSAHQDFVFEAQVDVEDWPAANVPILALSGYSNTPSYSTNGPGSGVGGSNVRWQLVANFANCTNTTTQYKSIFYNGGGLVLTSSQVDVVLNGWRPIASYLAALRNRIISGGSFTTPTNAVINIYDSANNHRQEVAAGRNKETWTQSQVVTLTATGSVATSIVIPAGYSIIDYSWLVGGTALGQSTNLGWTGSTTALGSALSGSANANPLIGAFTPVLVTSQQTILLTAATGSYTSGAQVFLTVTCQANWSVL